MENFLTIAQTETSAAIVAFNLLLAFIIGLGIALTYKKTHQGLSYSRQFISTLVIMSVLGSVVMMVVSQNFIGAFALLGAFSLIRFRTILKETRDIAFVFFTLVEGVAIGTNNYTIGLISTAVIILIILGLQKTNFGSVIKGGFILSIVAKNPFSLEKKSSWQKLLRSHKILSIRSLAGSTKEYILNVNLLNDTNSDKLINDLKSEEGVEEVGLTSGENPVEY